MDTVLLTGAASGIGRATAWHLARLGHRCVLVDRNAAALEELLTQLHAAKKANVDADADADADCVAAPIARPSRTGATDRPAPQSQAPATVHVEHLARVVDLTDPEQILALADGMPTLNAIINNAGMTDASNLPIVEQHDRDWQRLLDLNLHAPPRLLRALQGRLAPHARIVNVASGAGLHAIPLRGAYSPSKAGLIAQTHALARARPDLGVSVLCPGFVQTELVDGLIASGRLDPVRAVAKIPLGRLAKPEELACALAFLASRDAASLSGSRLSVDGGSSVFGGSQAYAPNAIPAVPCDTPLSLTVHGGWPGLGSTDTRDGYAAIIDTSVLHSPLGGRLAATLAAAQRHGGGSGPGSLTLLLPRAVQADFQVDSQVDSQAHFQPDFQMDSETNSQVDSHTNSPTAWEHAGDDAAARMLIATLACEWGPRARRINAVEVDAANPDPALNPLLRFVAGAEAQYLTGQTLCTR
ncbi:MAG: SDR family oxidoreductase [Achromobacter sp.]|uniref:SDR family NAD(P)-dependent oxidoreductase n=1 Tax=Achromobacter sp. TaxID=134375 RepID=UPI0029A53948|nr:SDR family oxidoreductase [Achromobacter sp.]MDX3986281.1 SDR family oxidoreductase [Achromobacter sp.]